MTSLSSKRIVLGITGSIAAYKAAELTRLLVKQGATVDVVLTTAAEHFIGAATFQALTGRPVIQNLWESPHRGMSHIDLVRGADAVLVAPASADFLAKVTQGLADDLLSTLCLARNCPLLLAPAMNREMWANPATRRNVAQLTADGILLLGPVSGEQACGETGEGRLLEPAAIADDLIAFFQPKILSGKKVLLTAGPTFEAIDPVRGLTNASSGKMGFALAQACAEAGAEVTLVTGPVNLPTPRGVTKRIDVTHALQMREAVLQRIADQSVFIGVAAVADYRPAQSSDQKIKKTGNPLTLDLLPNPDILAEVAALPAAPFCVGFAAESHHLEEQAEAKRRAKKLPLLIGNLVCDGLGGDTNKITLFDDTGTRTLPPGTKLDLARTLVQIIAEKTCTST